MNSQDFWFKMSVMSWIYSILISKGDDSEDDRNSPKSEMQHILNILVRSSWQILS